jgi:hypothetical protein
LDTHPVQPIDLVLAVLGEAANAGVSLSKTKLLKLLYLIDLEVYRATGRIATRWSWKFLHFGPWTAEYDRALEALSADARIAIVVIPGDRDRETNLIRTNERERDVFALDESAIRIAARHVITRWLSRELPEILDYVYFETEPMHAAERGATLSFEAVERDVPAPYAREQSRGGNAKIQELRRKLGLNRTADVAGQHAPRNDQFTPPKYDESALELLRTLEDD